MAVGRTNFADLAAAGGAKAARPSGARLAAGAVATVLRRKRGAALEDAVHAAVFQELAEVGYAGFTIEAVASRARTGKASIYRRWATKQDLVIDAFCSRFGTPDDFVGETMRDASTRDILLHIARRILVTAGVAGEAIRAVACEARRDPVLADAIDKRVHCPKRAAMLSILQRGVERRDVRPDAADEIFADVLPALLMYQTILMNRPMTEDDIVEAVDRIVMPLLAP